jgi:hypothetical protein
VRFSKYKLTHQLPTDPGVEIKAKRRNGYQIPDAGCRMPDARCQIPDARYQVQDTGYQMPDAGYQMPDSRCQTVDAGLLRNLEFGLIRVIIFYWT